MTASTPEAVWAVVVGYNHVADSQACLESLVAGGFPAARIVFVDNASADDSAAIIGRAFPAAVVIRLPENVGFARGYNVGMAQALAQGADFVFILNNDTVVDGHTVDRLVAEARAHPQAGIIAPKIYYYDQPQVVWSAGCRYRRVPPAVVLRRTPTADDGRYDADPRLTFVTTCALLFPRACLEQIGLLDPNFFILHDDYDLSIRARQAGYALRLAPTAHLWHKVSLSTQVGTPNPFVWQQAGRSEAIFRRRHRRAYPWLTGWAHRAYVLLRMVAEGQHYGVRPFLAGWRQGQRAELRPVPRWNDPLLLEQARERIVRPPDFS
ncbi:MAG: glycosyltransferase family 2 protein [Candidatus Marinimicrobia bacterium]|nr:glycosyltransferase family 2 protein [Candidatus Neomarinimicrobiota bacterium]